MCHVLSVSDVQTTPALVIQEDGTGVHFGVPGNKPNAKLLSQWAKQKRSNLKAAATTRTSTCNVCRKRKDKDLTKMAWIICSTNRCKNSAHVRCTPLRVIMDNPTLKKVTWWCKKCKATRVSKKK